MGEYVVAVLSLAAGVFAWSAAAKLRDHGAYRSFRDGLGEARLVPAHLLSAIAAVLAGAELVAALLPATAVVATDLGYAYAVALGRLALTASALLTAVLAAGVAVAIRRGTRARCACFGARAGRPLGRVHLIRNLVLLVTQLSGLAASVAGAGRPPALAAALATTTGAVVALLFIEWDDLVELFAPLSAPAVGTGRGGRRRGGDR